MKFIARLIATLGFLPGLALAATSGPLDPGMGEMSCFHRIYDAQHLQLHPTQKVDTAYLSLTHLEDGIFGELQFTTIGDTRADNLVSARGMCRASGASLVCELDGHAGKFTVQAVDGGVLVQVRGRSTLVFHGEVKVDAQGKPLPPALTLSGQDAENRAFRLPGQARAECY